MKVKTANLKGAALNWAVAKCEGLLDSRGRISDEYIDSLRSHQTGDFTSDWSVAGPIIEREGLLVRPEPDKVWSAWRHGADYPNFSSGPTPLIAAMRCYVASRMGDEIEIPDEQASSVVKQVEQSASPRTKVVELKGSDLDLAVATANPAYVALSPAAKAAAICAFTSGIQSYDDAVALYDAMAASDEPLDALIDKYPDVRRWGPVEELSEAEWWQEVEMLADSIMRAEAHFAQANVLADSQDEGDGVTDAPRPT